MQVTQHALCVCSHEYFILAYLWPYWCRRVSLVGGNRQILSQKKTHMIWTFTKHSIFIFVNEKPNNWPLILQRRDRAKLHTIIHTIILPFGIPYRVWQGCPTWECKSKQRAIKHSSGCWSFVRIIANLFRAGK